jgi:hypothetical protein
MVGSFVRRVKWALIRRFASKPFDELRANGKG